MDAALAANSGTRALVMTMGALHAGHLSLVAAAREAADVVVVSIFVNPLQFGPDEDFEAYPRDLENDLALLGEDADIVFAPPTAEIYPRDPFVRIDPGPAATILEGVERPGHFAGVLQVVHKVLNLVRPDMTFFGRKDAQQLALVRTMVTDLNMPVDVRDVPIARDPDGLALSSRNVYLSETERDSALSLNRALHAADDAARAGAPWNEVREAAVAVLEAEPGVTPDYVAVVDRDTFVLAEDAEPNHALVVLAARVGARPTRLLDNREVSHD